MSRAETAGGGLRLAIGVVTRGRAGILVETIAAMRAQSRPAERILVCYTEDADIAGLPPGAELKLLRAAAAGICLQRNRLLEAASDCDVLVFFDDDFFPAADYLAATERAFLADPAIVVTTGALLADGANGPGFPPARAREIVCAAGVGGEAAPVAAYNGYGCNMAVRLETLYRHRVTFDERLVLYAWYEDIDLSRRAGRFGRIVRLPAARGVHLGVKAGRGPGVRLGYAQVVNPLYLWRKGSFDLWRAAVSIGRNLAMNGLRAVRPEPYIDRRGRLRGNAMALRDLLLWRMQPERAARL